MSTLNIIEDCIFPAIDELQHSHPAAAQLTRSAGTILLGPESPLDSMALVSLIVAVEDRIEDATGRRVTLATEKAMSRRQSPFRTIGALAEYIHELLHEPPHG